MLTRFLACARTRGNGRTPRRGYLGDLGLTPVSLARISRDTGVGGAARASAALRALDEHLEREYGTPGGGDGGG